MDTASCPLCTPPGDELLWQNAYFRVIRVDGTPHPGFTRVIWQDHIAEMTQLSATERDGLMDIVYMVEQVQRRVLRPDKINLAALGNQVPHLHWHVIPRWHSDSHFPNPIWCAADPAQITAWTAQRQEIEARLPEYYTALHHELDR
ncbi:HIT family protein [Alcaligenaceae bacterium CGII-47]|nr:HIT family protein [Alcaligenaceae bacterium CGII-47]